MVPNLGRLVTTPAMVRQGGIPIGPSAGAGWSRGTHVARCRDSRSDRPSPGVGVVATGKAVLSPRRALITMSAPGPDGVWSIQPSIPGPRTARSVVGVASSSRRGSPVSSAITITACTGVTSVCRRASCSRASQESQSDTGGRHRSRRFLSRRHPPHARRGSAARFTSKWRPAGGPRRIAPSTGR